MYLYDNGDDDPLYVANPVICVSVWLRNITMMGSLVKNKVQIFTNNLIYK